MSDRASELAIERVMRQKKLQLEGNSQACANSAYRKRLDSFAREA